MFFCTSQFHGSRGTSGDGDRHRAPGPRVARSALRGHPVALWDSAATRRHVVADIPRPRALAEGGADASLFVLLARPVADLRAAGRPGAGDRSVAPSGSRGHRARRRARRGVPFGDAGATAHHRARGRPAHLLRLPALLRPDHDGLVPDRHLRRSDGLQPPARSGFRKCGLRVRGRRLFFYATWFISVWCFFAGVLSIIVLWQFREPRARLAVQ